MDLGEHADLIMIACALLTGVWVVTGIKGLLHEQALMIIRALGGTPPPPKPEPRWLALLRD